MDQVFPQRSCRVAASVLFALFFALSATAGPPKGSKKITQKVAQQSAPVPPSGPVSKLLERDMGNLIADLDVSADGTRVLLATRPDPEKAGAGKAALIMLDRAGRRLWQRPVSWGIRAQSLSPDGKFVVLSTYDGKLTALGPDGKTRWELEETCRPYVLKNHSIICHHDEDYAPDIAFDFFDRAGNKKFSYPISGDILAFALSSDERNFALALTGGRVVMLEQSTRNARSPARALWQKKLSGEIIDLAISEGAEPQVFALTRDTYAAPTKKPKDVQLQTLTRDGTILTPLVLEFSAEQLALSADGSTLVVRGARPSTLAVYETSPKFPPRPLGKLDATTESRAPGPSPDFAAGFALGGACNDCFLLWNTRDKKPHAIHTVPEATLFSVSRTKDPLLAVALDNGVLRLYRIRGEAPAYAK